jgi:DNA N-6-adenine-methyltransferase (Dam)
MTIAPALYSSAAEEWPTPPVFFAKLNRRYRFTLHPCATADNAVVPLYFTKEHDGLRQDWGTHRVFCNPPYGRRIGARAHKCFEASQAGRSLSCLSLPVPTPDGFIVGCRARPISSSFVAACALAQTLRHRSPRCSPSTHRLEPQ